MPFVGRVEELAVLSDALQDAIAGRPHLVVVSGEPVVGKTRLVAEFLERARTRGASTLAGTCHEGIAIPFLPIVSAVRPVADLTQLASELPTGLSGFDSLAAEQHRLGLFMAATTAVMDEATRRPVVLAIEDVHWADDPTAALLVHLAGSAIHEAASRRLPVVLLVTSRTGPSGERDVVARLSRHPWSLHIDLRPFTQHETHAFVTRHLPTAPTAELVLELHHATGGNPLLLESALERLSGNGRTAHRGLGHRVDAPQAIASDLRRRLDAVDEETRRVLVLAAILGDGRRVGVLETAGGVHAREALEDARAAGLIASAASGRYKFDHPEIREILLSGLSADDRKRWHCLVAEAIDASDDSEAFDLAHHLAVCERDTDRIAELAATAAQRALSSADWTTAVRASRLALDHAPDDGGCRRAEMLYRLGLAAYYALDPTAETVLREAARLARERGCLSIWAESAILAARCRLNASAATIGEPPNIAELKTLTDTVGDSDPRLAARLLATMAELSLVSLQSERALEYATLAEAAMPSTAATADVAKMNVTVGLQQLFEGQVAASRSRFAAAKRQAQSAGDLLTATGAGAREGLAMFVLGDLAGAEDAFDTARREMSRYGFWGDHQVASAGRGMLALVRGALGEAEQFVGEALDFYRTTEYAFTPGLAYPALCIARALSGDIAGAARAVSDWQREKGRGSWRYAAFVDSAAGSMASARHMLEERPWRTGTEFSLFAIEHAAVTVEVAARLGLPEPAKGPARLLDEAADRGVVFSAAGGWFVPRLRAEAARLSSDLGAAARLFRDGHALARRIGAHVEAARCEVGLLALAGDASDAEHLASAAERLDALGALAAAQEARTRIRAVAGTGIAAQRTIRAILVTDLEDSTGLHVRVGDSRYIELLDEHDGIIRRRLRERGGHQFKHTGDGIAAWFPSASDAITCALEIRSDLARATTVHPQNPLVARLGIAAGEPVDVGADLFGLAVVMASRICDHASPGQLLVADEVPSLTRGKGFSFASVGSVALKGVPGTVFVHEVVAGPESG